MTENLATDGMMIYRVTLDGIESVKIRNLKEAGKFLGMPNASKIEPASLIEVLENENEIPIHTLISGRNFLEKIKEGTLNNNNGYVSDVIVDGFVTNLRFCFFGYKDLFGFLIDETFFENLLKEKNILINWNYFDF